jgi:hypothetical protein
MGHHSLLGLFSRRYNHGPRWVSTSVLLLALLALWPLPLINVIPGAIIVLIAVELTFRRTACFCSPWPRRCCRWQPSGVDVGGELLCGGWGIRRCRRAGGHRRGAPYPSLVSNERRTGRDGLRQILLPKRLSATTATTKCRSRRKIPASDRPAIASAAAWRERSKNKTTSY